jgi:hypothetical protein
MFLVHIMTDIIRRTSAAGNLLSDVPALDGINLLVI